MATKAGKPHADTRLVKFLQKRILEMRPRKSQVEIAAEAGFVATNMLAMIKRGSARLPLDRVPALAKALDVDPAYIFQLTLEQHDPALARVVSDIVGAAVTRNEVAWLEEIRGASDHADPTLTGKARKAIRGIFGR
jgi:hypothetical protein